MLKYLHYDLLAKIDITNLKLVSEIQHITEHLILNNLVLLLTVLRPVNINVQAPLHFSTNTAVPVLNVSSLFIDM